MINRLVVVGASHAGTQLAFAAREKGYAGEIILVSDEDVLPYQRPPLSKAFLQGRIDESRLLLRPASYFMENRIQVRLGVRVSEINRSLNLAILADGTSVPYSALALATGARVRPLACPGANLGGIHYLRNLDDAKRIKEAARSGQRAVIVGGGFIGLESAAALVSLGVQVTVVETRDRLLQRAIPQILAAYLKQTHEGRGVRCLLGRQVTRCAGDRGFLEGVELDNREIIPCDFAVIGIGVIPNVEQAKAAGLHTEDGIVVDQNGATSDSRIYAAGDCARYPNPWVSGQDRLVRLESIQSANDLARSAASAIAGSPVGYHAVPWFWSDQYDLKVQIAGIAGSDDHIVVRGNMAAGKFSLFHFQGNCLVAVDSVNDSQIHMLARRLLAQRSMVSPADAANPDVNLGAHLST